MAEMARLFEEAQAGGGDRETALREREAALAEARRAEETARARETGCETALEDQKAAMMEAMNNCHGHSSSWKKRLHTS